MGIPSFSGPELAASNKALQDDAFAAGRATCTGLQVAPKIHAKGDRQVSEDQRQMGATVKRPSNTGLGGRKRDATQAKAIAGDLPFNWRALLPRPGDYFPCFVRGLGPTHNDGWAVGECPLHPGEETTLRVDLSDANGGWRCARCGAGDLVDFARRLHGLTFREAVTELLLFARTRSSRKGVDKLAVLAKHRRQVEDALPMTPLERAQHAKAIADQRKRDEGLW